MPVECWVIHTYSVFVFLVRFLLYHLQSRGRPSPLSWSLKQGAEISFHSSSNPTWHVHRGVLWNNFFCFQALVQRESLRSSVKLILRNSGDLIYLKSVPSMRVKGWVSWVTLRDTHKPRIFAHPGLSVNGSEFHTICATWCLLFR